MKSAGSISKPVSVAFDLSLFVPLLALCFWFVATGLVVQWLDDPNYAHGFFVVPMALALAFRRRHRLLETPAEPTAAGCWVLVLGGLIYLAGVLAAELFTMRFSLVVVFLGLVLATQGFRRARILLFPCLFLLLMIPLPYIFYYKLTFPLQLLSSRMTDGLLTALGMPVVRTGNVIHLEHYSLEVVTACSGLRSIMTLGTAAVFVSDFFSFGWIARAAFVALSIPVAVVANTARLTSAAVVSALASPDAADGFMHDLSGVLVFLFGLVCLIFVGGVLEWFNKRARRPKGAGRATRALD